MYLDPIFGPLYIVERSNSSVCVNYSTPNVFVTVEDADEFSNEWDKKTKTERHSRHQITAPQLAITRGLPSSSHGTAGLLSGQSRSVNNYGDDILTSHPSSTHQRPSHTHEQRSFQPRSRPYDDGLNKQGSSIHEQQRARKKRSKVKFNDQ